MADHQGQDPRDRSVSQSGDFDSDLDDDGSRSRSVTAGDSGNPPGKPGRKKNPNSQAARRDQNRVAQREFRLRKQQRIRDLEARVEILSGGKEEAIGEMRNMLKDLMTENQNLRQMLRNLAGFIGDGMGGVLPKLGWDVNDFNTFLNKGETDTAWEGYQRRKKQPQQGPESNAAAGPSSLAHKRPAEDSASSGRAKKSRNDDSDRGPNGFSMMGQLGQSSMGPGSVFSSDSERPGMYPDMIRSGHTQQMFPQSAGSDSSLPYAGMSNTMDGYGNGTYMGMTLNQPMPPSNYDPTAGASSQRPQGQSPAEELVVLDDDPNKMEAFKLIEYHLENYKRNPNYCLPSSLRPTSLQRTIPHESVLDRLLHPELRDRVILNRGKFDLVDLLLDFRKFTTIHGDDVLAHGNWEIDEGFFRKHPYLAEANCIAASNRWRKERGESELSQNDFGSEQPPPA
ncbi:hypothetical protein FA15DRAFT_664224 [Coprinopsis marcescibilis]|uniref:BZIP domain-containing protein n=1 Tax=Coprinopsis marcescibilis TaxID=230819 RepID=A0A5C3L947_COPMA|nr:hypothetical protein FA15DRAFT_664224 [Coprinopsis marcescibilis]